MDEAIALVGIEALRHKKIGRVSDGERQKVMIAKALAQQTGIILLDEPTAFLDYGSKVSVMRLLQRFKCTILLVLIMLIPEWYLMQRKMDIILQKHF